MVISLYVHELVSYLISPGVIPPITKIIKIGFSSDVELVGILSNSNWCFTSCVHPGDKVGEDTAGLILDLQLYKHGKMIQISSVIWIQSTS